MYVTLALDDNLQLVQHLVKNWNDNTKLSIVRIVQIPVDLKLENTTVWSLQTKRQDNL